MAFVIDSNVVIAAEPFNGQIEDLQPVVSSFMRIAAEHGHKMYVHPATLDDPRETTAIDNMRQHRGANDVSHVREQ